MMDGESIVSVSKIDECFGNTPASFYRLFTGVFSDSLQLLVFDPEKNKFVAYARQEIKSGGNRREYADQLKKSFEESNLLQYEYKDTLVIWESWRSTFVPNALFDPAETETYFRFNQSVETDDKIYADKLQIAGIYNVYSISESLEKSIGLRAYRDRHHASVFTESVLIWSKQKMLPKQVFLNVHPTFFDMLVTENGKLLFYNSFHYKTAEDFIYFVLFVYEQLKISPESNGVVLSGNILKNSVLFETLYKYIRHIEFAIPGEQYSNSYILKDLPAHTIYNLTGAVLCEL